MVGYCTCTVDTDCPSCLPGLGGGVTATAAVDETGDAVYVDKARATAVAVAPGLFAVVSYPVRITGGTGRLAGASGRIDNIGEVDLDRVLTVFRYTGRLCR